MRKKRLRGRKHHPVASSTAPYRRDPLTGALTEITNLPLAVQAQKIDARHREFQAHDPEDVTDFYLEVMREQGVLP